LNGFCAFVSRASQQSAVYLPDSLADPSDRSLLPFDRTLRVSDTWVLYVRQRSENFRVDDIKRLISKVEDAEIEAELPAPSQRLVKEPSGERLYGAEIGIDLTSTVLKLPEAARGWSGPQSGEGAGGEEEPAPGSKREIGTYFFPLAFNDEQIEIARRLDDTDGLVVQGPPGTGKTHTIANIICHYMATGRRVLVSAKTPEALTALQEKLPEGVRDLAISVIHNDREGARQLEKAVNLLANEAKHINPRLVTEEIKTKQHRLADLLAQIGQIDKQLLAYAEKHLSRLTFRGSEVLPMDLARLVVEERGVHQWLDDRLSLDPHFDPQFSDADVAEMSEIRRALKQDLVYGAAELPEPQHLPALARVVASHGELICSSDLDARATAGEIPHLQIGMDVSLDDARAMKSWLVNRRPTLTPDRRPTLTPLSGAF